MKMRRKLLAILLVIAVIFGLAVQTSFAAELPELSAPEDSYSDAEDLPEEDPLPDLPQEADDPAAEEELPGDTAPLPESEAADLAENDAADIEAPEPDVPENVAERRASAEPDIIKVEPPMLRRGDPVVVNVDITDFRIENYMHETPSSIFWTDVFYLALDWDASAYGADLHLGDYFDITLPDNMRFPSGTTASDFNLTDTDGTVVATAHVTPGPGDVGGSVHVTFTDAVENKFNVKGTMYLGAQFDRTQVTVGEQNTFTIIVNGDVSGQSQTIEAGVIVTGPKDLIDEYLGKWGGYVYNRPEEAQWTARINHTGATLSNVVITDTLGDSGQTFLRDSFLLQRVEYDIKGNVVRVLEVIDTSSILTFSPDGTSFTLDLGDLNGDQLRLEYKSTYEPGTYLRNRMTLTSAEVEKTFPATHHSPISGGTGTGDQSGKIIILKYDGETEMPLAGAVFQLTAPDGGTVTLTSDANGEATFDGLEAGEYTITEISPPPDYILDSEPHIITVEAGASVTLPIQNSAIERISIPVMKSWNGPAAGPVTIHLTADEEEIESLVLDETSGWTGSFDNLPKYDPNDGHEIYYDISEDPVENYEPAVEGSAARGFTVINTNTETVTVSGVKIWDDANDQDRIRPDSVTIRLLADGLEVQSRTVTAADDWSWSFPDLPKYAGEAEIVYSIIEDPVKDYSTSYDGYNVVNSYAPGKTSVTVVKSWDDQNDQDKIRPGSVTIHLLADGTDTGMTLVLSEANRWTGSFENLDEYRDGQKIIYSITEESASGYSQTIRGSADKGFTVTNAHVPEQPPRNTESPKTGDSSPVLFYGVLMLISLAAAVSILLRVKKWHDPNGR